MVLIQSFCMNESNKIYVLNEKKRRKKRKQKEKKKPNQKRNVQVSQKSAFMLKNVISLVFCIQRLRDTQLFFPMQQAKIINKS